MFESKLRNRIILLFSLSLTFLFLSQSITAMPLSPELVEKLRESGELQKFVDRMTTAKANGVCQPFSDTHTKSKFDFSADSETVDTFRVVVILADFSDNQAVNGGVFGTVSDFELLLFSNDSTDSQYSMTEFYYDNSYGNFVLEGVVSGWYRLPQTYAYYVDGDNGFGGYPRSAQRMTEDAILLADPNVDFSQFDNDGNGTADGVFIVHAGTGAESTGSDDQIWSHASSTSYTMHLDGISISRYTTEPEELSGQLITQGVFSHEYGHFLGLPDLYDTDYSSNGLGSWSLMAGGSWNSNGIRPAFFDAWCKKELGFTTPTNINFNQTQLEIPSSYYNATSFRLWENGNGGQEYFLIENRQKTNKDSGIPGSGLLIYHIDETQWGNSNENNYLVGIEAADGKFDLENDVNSGDNEDVWPIYNKNEFTDVTVPNTKKYNGSSTNTLVWDISPTDSLMYANLDISYSSPRFSITNTEFSDAQFGNNNGIAEVGETLTFTFYVNNLWLTANNVTAEMVSGNPDITFSTPIVNIGTVVGNGGNGSNVGIPIVFDVPVTYDACIDSFNLTITSDNSLGEITQGVELQIGTPQIVIIDDDNGDTWEESIVNSFKNFKIPHDIYDKSLLGSPTAGYLNDYEIVVWFTGSNRPDIFSPDDVTAMQGYMDAGGNILLSGQSVAEELSSDDLSFIQSYFKAEYLSDVFFPEIRGQIGTVIGDGIKLSYDTYTNQTSPERMNLADVGGVSEFELPIGGVTGISYDGSYKSLFLSFGIEGITNTSEAYGYATQDTVFARILKFFDYGDVNKYTNPNVDSISFPNEVSHSSVVNSLPFFSWNYADTNGTSQLQYQIQVGTGTFCINSNDMWESGILTGAIDSIQYSGAVLEEGSTYYVRIRAYNGADWSSWRRTTFTMAAPNIAPVVGSIGAPSNNMHHTLNPPLLSILNGYDANGDVLTYDFEIYNDSLLTSLVSSVSSFPEGFSSTSWEVGDTLVEDARYFWRARVSDGAMYSEYSQVSSFYINEFNQPPNAFSLIAPSDESVSIGIFPTFVWNRTTDADAADSSYYTLFYSEDSLFGGTTYSYITNDTMFNTGLALFDNVVYYWKVYAFDLSQDSTMTTVYSFNTGTGGCCLDTRGNVDNDVADETDISDLVYMVDFIFTNGPAPVCVDEANVDGNIDGDIDISDLVYIVDFIFTGGPPPPNCP